MKQRMILHKISALFLCTFIILNIIPVRVHAEDYVEATYYDPLQKMEVTVSAQKLSDHLDGTLKSGWYVADTPALRFDNQITIQGDVNLILPNNTLTYAAEGIFVSYHESLTIWSREIENDRIMGTLMAEPSESSSPAIGGGKDESGGTLVVNGGKIFAYGGKNSAGIGGSRYTDMKSVTINAGFVEAEGDFGAAGIGSGYQGDFCGTVTIRGGYVRATGGDVSSAGNHGTGAGIGAGYDGNAKKGNINIFGGTVIAESRGFSAGIGGGEEDLSYGGGEGANVNILGGVTYAISKFCAIGHGGTDVVFDHSDDYMGDLTIADHMMVSAGNSSIEDVEVFTNGERVAACNYRKYARIEPCDHADFQFININERTHTEACRYCNYTLEPEYHELDQTGKCKKCGGTGKTYMIVFDYDNEAEDPVSREYITDVRYPMPEFDGTVPEGKAFRAWFLKNSTIYKEYAAGEIFSIHEDATASAVYVDLPKILIEHDYRGDFFDIGDFQVVTSEKPYAETGTQVDLTLKNTGLYRVYDLNGEDALKNKIEIKTDQGSSNTAYFVMPKAGAYLNYKLEFSVSDNDHGEGNVDYDKTFYKEGETVKFKAVPDGGCRLNDLNILVKDKTGYGKHVLIEITPLGNDEYS
ncbi:MAG: hypothetical protein J6S49_03850, partial [Erysipelotrichaceae bacterium]|nr:hypothetical protein [Erysipelotrichaceae bacterium]